MEVRFYPSAMARGISIGGIWRAARAGRSVGLVALGVVLPLLSAGVASSAEVRRFRVDPARSGIDVKVGTAGLFRFAGHDHLVRVPVAKGEVIVDPSNLGASKVWLGFDSAAIRVVSSEGGAEEIPKVQEKMAGPVVLDVARFPEARFESRRVSGRAAAEPGVFDLEVEGDLTLRGVTRAVTARLRAELGASTLSVKGPVRLKQSDFGIDPVSVAGLVKVKNELALELAIVAVSEGGE